MLLGVYLGECVCRGGGEESDGVRKISKDWSCHYGELSTNMRKARPEVVTQ